MGGNGHSRRAAQYSILDIIVAVALILARHEDWPGSHIHIAILFREMSSERLQTENVMSEYHLSYLQRREKLLLGMKNEKYGHRSAFGKYLQSGPIVAIKSVTHLRTDIT